MGTLVSLYPGGAAGLSLLLLRLSLAVELVFLTAWHVIPVPDWVSVLAGIVALGLVLGLLNSFLAAAYALAAVVAFVEIGNTIGVLCAIGGAISISLALLGPGAYSVDARLFGRRVFSIDG